MTALTFSGRSGRTDNLTENRDRIAFWLLPAKEDEPPLRRLIEELAARFNSVIFPPHLTLLTLPAEERPDPVAFLAQFGRANSALSLTVAARPQWQPVFNRALSLPIDRTEALLKLRRNLGSAPAGESDYQPHLSLLYGNLDPATDRQLTGEVRLTKRQLCFDRIAAVRIGPQTTSAEDVRGWQVVAVQSLCS